MSKTPTTVHLTELAYKVKVKYANAYGLKNMLSAGVLLFNTLTAAQRETIVNIVNDEIDLDAAEAALRAALKPEDKRKRRGPPPKA